MYQEFDLIRADIIKSQEPPPSSQDALVVGSKLRHANALNFSPGRSFVVADGALGRGIYFFAQSATYVTD